MQTCDYILVPGEASSRQHCMADVAEILQRIERYNRLYGERSIGLMQFEGSADSIRSKCKMKSNLKGDLHDFEVNCVLFFTYARSSLSSQEIVTIMDPQRSLPLVIRAHVYLAFTLSAIYVISPVDIIPEVCEVFSVSWMI
ncbi:hypothetical protein OROGR_032547 [Orobanche gracilis]